MAKLTEAELDDWAAYWSQYFQFVLDRNRERRVEDVQTRRAAFEAKRQENEAALERIRQRGYERERAIRRNNGA